MRQLSKQYMSLVDVALLAGLCAILQYWMPVLRLLAYDTPCYTFLTGHLVHLHWQHWLMNMLALFCLPVLMPRVKRWQFWFASGLFSAGISVMLIFGNQLQQLHNYVGFSGVLHGLYMLFALLTLCKTSQRYMKIQSILLVLGLLVKTLYEMLTQPIHSAEFLGAPVVYAAHMDGVILGVMGFVGLCLLYSIRQSS